jgi:HEAT repeat protein
MSLPYLVVSAVVMLAQTPAAPPTSPAPKARVTRPPRPPLDALIPPAPALAELRAELDAAAMALEATPPLPPAMELGANLDMVAPALLEAEAALARLPSIIDAPLALWDDDVPDTQGKEDSLYREARRELNRNRYTRAAQLFKEFREKNPNSEAVAEALYFEAFALYRGGDVNQLREARARLQEQETKFPRAATRGDARTLRVRVLQSLAERGDEEAARRIRQLADSAPVPPRAVTVHPPRPPEPPRPARAHWNQSCDGDDDDDMRLMALNALLQMNSEQAIPILKSVLSKRDSGSVCLRRRAVFLVSQKRSSEASGILLDAARNDPDLEVRLQAVQWLSQVRSEEAAVALDSILRTAKDVELQEKAVFALSQMRSDRAAATLRSYAERSDVPVAIRERTIFWLGQQRSAENAAFLRGLYAKLQNDELKERVLFSLSQMKEQGNDRWLLDLAGNEREPLEIRKRALFYAGQSGAPIADLTALYDRTRDREMKEQLIFVYSQRRGTEAVDKLLDIAKRETDTELRKKAVFWLGQSRDPRAAQFLIDLINQP